MIRESVDDRIVEPPDRLDGRRRVKGHDVSLGEWGGPPERAAITGLSAVSR